MSIRRLPYEMTAYIARHLDLYDVYNLSATCHHFRFLTLEHNICRAVLEATPSSASEVQQARSDGKYARALRRLVKRREAISSASPFLASIVAVAETWIYKHGVLCYIRDRELRILDIHNSADREIVVNIRSLLDAAVQDSRTRTKYKFRLLYYAHHIVSCLYTHARPDRASWLVVFNPLENRILTARSVESPHKIFVRNDQQHLYYGTFSEIGFDGFRRWALCGFDILKGEWFDGKLHIPEIMGSDIGSTTCFEIINGYFYGITNQTCFEIEEIDWTSYYYCFRFPTHQPSRQATEWPSRRQRWRRQHAEGPIDDRWTFLKLFEDEISGDLKIIESRKEWLSGHGSATRTYYTKKLVFGGDDEDEDAERDGQCQSTGSLYPVDDQLARLLGKEDHPNYMPALKRKPEDVHMGDNSSISVMFTLNKCHIRSYHHHAPQTFVDLVDDPHPLEADTQRIRVRAGSRHLRTKEERQERIRASTAQYGDSYSLKQEIEDLYEHAEVAYWPREQPVTSAPLGQDELHQILNPPSYSGNVHGEWDERSLIYATGGTFSGGLKALVLISFDPAIYLKGVRQFGSHSPEQSSHPDLDALHRFAGLALDKGKERKEQDLAATSPTSTQSPSSGVAHEFMSTAQPSTWATYEPALYQAIGKGYHFAI